MKTTGIFAALLALAVFAPQAYSQAKAPAIDNVAASATLSTSKRTLKQPTDARWNSMLESAGQLTREGAETRRIAPPESQSLNTEINRIRALIAAARQGGISEAEEDQVDNAIAALYDRFAGFMADPGRKKVAVVKPRPGMTPVATGKTPAPLDKKQKMAQRWNVMLESAATLAREGAEAKRITAAELSQINEQIRRNQALVTKARSGGVTEAEEDVVDDELAQMYSNIAKYMGDQQRKRAALGLK